MAAGFSVEGIWVVGVDVGDEFGVEDGDVRGEWIGGEGGCGRDREGEGWAGWGVLGRLTVHFLIGLDWVEVK